MLQQTLAATKRTVIAVCFLAMVSPVSSARCDATTGTCQELAAATAAATANRTEKRGGETVLMQLATQKALLAARAQAVRKVDKANESVVAEMAATDAVVARRIREFSVDPMNVARTIRCGLLAILNSLTHFMAQPPKIAEGIVQLGMDLYNCIKGLLLPHLENTPYNLLDDGVIETEWHGAFDIIASVDSIAADIEEFSRNGDPPHLVRGIGSILGEAGSIVANFLPSETGREIRKYLTAVAEAFETMGTSWDDFAKGRTAQGIESIYLGLKSITDDLMPEAWKNNTIYVSIVASLDTVLGNLSQHVLEYERRIVEANVCWRNEKHRERLRPTICPEGWVSGGDAYCYPLASLEQLKAKEGQLDTAVQAKTSEEARPQGAVPARCDRLSKFPEKHGRFCYSKCDDGFLPKSSSKCISSCEGDFPAETPAMCGRDRGIAIRAIIEMVTTVMNAGFSLAENIITMKEHGVDATALSSTIQTFIDMGKPFANPVCPAPNGNVEQGVADQNQEVIPASPLPTPAPHLTCTTGEKVFITSHRNEQLQDKYGYVRFTHYKDEWEKWILSDAGDGNVFITSHRGAQLADHQGHVVMSWNRRGWETFKLTDAGNGKVYITGHQKTHLQDFHDKAKLSWNADDWEAFEVTDTSGANACRFA